MTSWRFKESLSPSISHGKYLETKSSHKLQGLTDLPCFSSLGCLYHTEDAPSGSRPAQIQGVNISTKLIEDALLSALSFIQDFGNRNAQACRLIADLVSGK